MHRLRAVQVMSIQGGLDMDSNIFQEGFEAMIGELGDVIIIHSKNKVYEDGEVVKDERGRVTYTIENIDSMAFIKDVKPNSSLISNGVLSIGDGTGLFYLDDHPYLRVNTEITRIQEMPDGELIRTKYKMQKPVFKKGHIEALIKQVVV